MGNNEDPNDPNQNEYDDGYEDYFEPPEPLWLDATNQALEKGDLTAIFGIGSTLMAAHAGLLRWAGIMLPAQVAGIAGVVFAVAGAYSYFYLKPVDPAAKLDLSGPLKLVITEGDNAPGPKRDAGILTATLDGQPVTIENYSGTLSIQSVAFPPCSLRMDGSTITEFNGNGGGSVNCQFGASSAEQFRLVIQEDGSVAIGSVEFPDRYLRMDGGGVGTFQDDGSGVVNCQFGVGPFEKFQIVPGGGDTVAIRSLYFFGSYLRMDASAVEGFLDGGGGTVNCQYRLGDWEKFRLIAS